MWAEYLCRNVTCVCLLMDLRRLHRINCQWWRRNNFPTLTPVFRSPREKHFRLYNVELFFFFFLSEQKLRRPKKTSNGDKSPVRPWRVQKHILLASCCLHTFSACVHTCRPAELPVVQSLVYTSRCVFFFFFRPPAQIRIKSETSVGDVLIL